jgi:RNA-directed DNA polymerase
MPNDRQKFTHKFENIISLENLLLAWREFLRGKRSKKDVQKFEYKLFDEIFRLHHELQTGIYKHGQYKSFNISDPKPRKIHKASVRDRLIHHAIHRQLYPFFDNKFIADSFSCRLNKGTLRAIDRFRIFAYKVGKNNTRTVWVLKCDIQKFFASIDQKLLIKILESFIVDGKITRLLKKIIYSFNSGRREKGLPLGNLTSQLFANIYMNEFDQFVKHKLKVKYYIRYTDDFVILDYRKCELESILLKIEHFLKSRLKILLNSGKVFIRTLDSGVDFLGWVHFPKYRIIRTTTKRKILKKSKIRGEMNLQSIQSYLGLLRHGNTNKLRKRIISNLDI